MTPYPRRRHSANPANPAVTIITIITIITTKTPSKTKGEPHSRQLGHQ